LPLRPVEILPLFSASHIAEKACQRESCSSPQAEVADRDVEAIAVDREVSCCITFCRGSCPGLWGLVPGEQLYRAQKP
jgi:hypothetical protein